MVTKVPPRTNDIAYLAQPFRRMACNVYSRIKGEGLPFIIWETGRSPVRQMYYFYRGRRWTGEKWERISNISTKAPPMGSPHEFGMAIDFVLDSQTPWRMDSETRPLWDRLGEIAVSEGLRWGGHWRSFKDFPHVELPNWRKYRPVDFKRKRAFYMGNWVANNPWDSRDSSLRYW